MATDSDKKLTRYTSAVTVVTAEVMNALYGGEYANNLALYAVDQYHPLVAGHIHDGEHSDGHASKVLLTNAAHVRGALSHANLGGTEGTNTSPAVQKDNIQCYPETQYGPHGVGVAIPVYDVDPDTSERCYYLDLSMMVGGSDKQVQYNKDGEFAGDEGFVYDYDNVRVGVGTASPWKRLSIEGELGEGSVEIREHGDSASGPDIVFSKSRGTGLGGVVHDGDNLGSIGATGWDGDSWEHYSGILQFRVDGIPGDNDIPGEFAIMTRPAGVSGISASLHTRLVAKSDGKIGIGTLTPSAKLDVDGDGIFSGDLAVGGKLTVAGLIDPTGLILEEEEPTSEKMPTGPGKGAIFVAKAGSVDENDAALEVNKLYYKDEGSIITKLGGGGEPFLPDRSVQFNDNGTFAGDSSVIIDSDLNLGVGVTGNLEPARRLHVRDDRAGSHPPVRINDLTLGDGEYVVWEAATGDLYHKPLPASAVPGGHLGDLQWHDPNGGLGGSSDLTFDSSQGFVGIGGMSAATPDQALEVFGGFHLSKEEPFPISPPAAADGGVLWVDTSGELNYSSDNVQGTVTNVQPDWNATSGDSFIQNQPTTITSQQANDIAASVNHAGSAHAPSGATINSSDAVLQDRANHTGTQTAVTISDFAAEVSGNATVTANTLHIGSAHAPSGATINSSDAVLQDRANHTGTQTAVTISDFAAEVSGNATVVANTGKITFPGFGSTNSTCLAGNTAVGDINVQSNWNSTSGDTAIINKPTLQLASINGHMNEQHISTGSGFVNGDVITKGDNGNGYFASSTNGQDVYAYNKDATDLISGQIGIDRGMMMSPFTATTTTLIRSITFSVIEDSSSPRGLTDKYRMFIWKFPQPSGALSGAMVNVTSVISNLGTSYVELPMASGGKTGYQEVTDSYGNKSSSQLAAGDKLIIGLEMVNSSSRTHDSFRFAVNINFEL
jgi:hypothetical protein